MKDEPAVIPLVRRRSAGSSGEPDYPLGYTESELARLQRQADFLGDLTLDALRRAGIGAGMRVLDVGCGVGDVAFLAGDLVGPSGEVLGVDRCGRAVAEARQRAAAAGLPQVRFAVGDLESFTTIQTFDALVGRLVLMYLPTPATTLRHLCQHLSPGGTVVIQEMAMPLARSLPEGPLFRRCRDWIIDAFTRAGAECDMDSKLHAAFAAAGLPEPQMISAGRVEAGRDSAVYGYMAETLRSLLPTMERLRIATAAEVEADTLAARLCEEAAALDACIMPPPLIAAWTRTA